MIGVLRHQKWLPNPFRQSTLGPPLLVETQLAVNAVDPFVVPGMPESAQSAETLPEAPTSMPLNRLVQRLDDIGITLSRGCWYFVKSCPGYTDTAATALY